LRIGEEELRRRIYWFTYSFNKCRAREVREMVEKDTGLMRQMRQSHQEHILMMKAAEQEKMGMTIGREWENSNENSIGDVIEAQMDVPKAPQPARR
jgi:hypothetical protein